MIPPADRGPNSNTAQRTLPGFAYELHHKTPGTVTFVLLQEVGRFEQVQRELNIQPGSRSEQTF
jgi:hypothetical protein